jgi:hypothetical protein
LIHIGLPLLEIPAGRSRHGLPIGLQLVGRPFGDETAIALGRAFKVQTATNHHRQVPEFHARSLPADYGGTEADIARRSQTGSCGQEGYSLNTEI